MTSSDGIAWMRRISLSTARAWRTASTTLPVPASPLVRIMLAPSPMRRSASPMFVAPHTNGTVNANLSMWCASSAGVRTSLSSTKSTPSASRLCASTKWPMRAFAITGIDTASTMPRIMSGSDMRATPPWERMSAGTRSSAITAVAPASSAMRACSAFTTSMMTPPLNISAKPVLTVVVPMAVVVWLDSSFTDTASRFVLALLSCRSCAPPCTPGAHEQGKAPKPGPKRATCRARASPPTERHVPLQHGQPRSLVQQLAGALDALRDAARQICQVERGTGVELHHVALRAFPLAGQDGARGDRVVGRIAAQQRLPRGTLQADVLGGERVLDDLAVRPQLRDERLAADGEVVQPVAVHDQRPLEPEPPQHLGQGPGERRAVHPHELPRRPGGVRERTEIVEDRAGLEVGPDGGDEPHRRMVLSREQERQPDLLDRTGQAVRIQIEADTESLEHVRGAAALRHPAVSVLRKACAPRRRHECRRGADVDRAHARAAGTADVQQRTGVRDRHADRALAHRLGEAHDLVHGLTPRAQRGQEGRGLHLRQLAVHQPAHHLAGPLARQRASVEHGGKRAGDVEVVRRCFRVAHRSPPSGSARPRRGAPSARPRA